MSSTIAESEYKLFIDSMASKSANTQRSYKTQYKKLSGLMVTDGVHQNSEKTLIGLANDQSNANSQQALLNIGILIRKLYELPVDKMLKFRDRNKVKLQENVKESNKYLSNLPTLKDLEEFTDHLYDNKEYLDYAINFLLLEYNVRNADLALEIVTKKRDANDKTKNYLWITPKKVTFIRNNYKTSDTYGTKTHIITDKKFMFAIKYLLKCQSKKDSNKMCFFPSTEQAGYVVKKASYQQLGSGTYFKIAVDTHRNDLQKIRQMGLNRGTATDTIADNYDINNL
tara:strand:- start:204 stop:1055 length:852 start_codon:yes stop_codon:yes gene_type:complete